MKSKFIDGLILSYKKQFPERVKEGDWLINTPYDKFKEKNLSRFLDAYEMFLNDFQVLVDICGDYLQ